MSKANSFTPNKDSHFLYFCGGNPECEAQRGCIFWDDANYDCCRTPRIEYAKNKEKFKTQLLDGTFPHIEDWIEEGGNYIERG